MKERSTMQRRMSIPVPDILSVPAVGLDITDRRVRFLELVPGSGGRVVKRYGEVVVPQGIIIGGAIKKPLEFSAILQGIKRKHGFEFVRVSLPEERAYIVHMDIPRVDQKEVRDAIAFQLEEYVPLKPDTAIFDYIVLPQQKENEEMMHVLVAVMPREDIVSYTDILSNVGMTPLTLEIEGQAIARALVSQEDDNVYMLVDFGKMRTGVSVIKEGTVRFTSTVDVGSDMLTQAIMEHMNVPQEEAEKIKNERALVRQTDDFWKAISGTVDRLSNEINKLYEYWHTYHADKPGEGPIKGILVCGGGANLKGLDQYLSQSLRVSVSIGNPWGNINVFETYIPPMVHSEALGYVTVIGLAMPTDRTI